MKFINFRLRTFFWEKKIQNLESEQKLTKAEAKSYSNDMRLMVFDAITSHVPTANVHNLIPKFALCCNVSLSDVPKRATVEAMTREL